MKRGNIVDSCNSKLLHQSQDSKILKSNNNVKIMRHIFKRPYIKYLMSENVLNIE